MTIDPHAKVDAVDALEHLQASGFARLLSALQSPSVYTRAGDGSLVLTALARRMRISPRQAAKQLAAARAALQ